MLERRSSSQQQKQRQKPKQRHHGVAVESKPWISESEQLKARGQSPSLSSFSPPRPPHSLTEEPSNGAGNGGNVDRVLFNNLVEMVPLVESLMDRRGNSSFTRRASMIYTPAPSLKKKNVEPKSHEAASTKKNRVIGDNNTSDKQTAASNEGIGTDGLSMFSTRSFVAEKEREDLCMLRGQVDELQKKLLAKDESLKSAESSLQSAQVALDDLKRQLVEKDSLVKSVHSDLNNTKIKLAGKQAALEKLEWENREANSKSEKLQHNLASADFEIGAFMQFCEKLSKNQSVATLDESIICFDHFDYLPSIEIDEAAIEQARSAYEAALAFAKDNPGEGTLALASEARMKLHSLVV